jgi:response regulator of citrate/malate metabolism
MISAQEKNKIIQEAIDLGVNSYITKGQPNMNIQIEQALDNYRSMN